MSTSLYQKYRPQQFSDMIGQDHIQKTLLQELRVDAISHAYLFSGPRGVGKTTSARVFARAVNCLSRIDGEPCDRCVSCVQILSGATFDIIEIDAASHTGVDNVRDNIIENARVAPAQLAWKVFIIDEVHMLSIAAFNALLKTLEEPPKQTLFILATTELQKVPATILSRCERFLFHRISPTDMVRRLQYIVDAEKKEVNEDVLYAIAKRAQGAQRDAETLLGQILVLDENPITLASAALIVPQSHTASLLLCFQAIVQKETQTVLEHIEEIFSQGVSMNDFSRDWIEFLRLMLFFSVSKDLNVFEYTDLSAQEKETIQKLCDTISPSDISFFLQRFLEADLSIATSPIETVPIELGFVDVIERFYGKTEETNKRSVDGEKKRVSTPSVSNDAPSIRTEKKEEEKKEAQEKAPPVQTVQKKETPSATIQHTLEQKKSMPKKSDSVSDAPITEDLVKKKWKELLTEMNHHNHALKLTFQVATVVDVTDNIMTLGFEHQFYKDRIEDHRNSDVIHTVLETVFGTKVRVIASVSSDHGVKKEEMVSDTVADPSEDDLANVWDLASAAFGSTGTTE